MTLYDEAEVIQQIKTLPVDVRNHLSHVYRNWLMRIVASNRRDNPDVENAIFSVEKELKEMGL